MNVKIEIGEDGVMKVNDPNWLGKKFTLDIPSNDEPKGLTNWDEIWEIFHEADQINFSRCSPDEIERDLHEFRDSGL